MILRDDFLVPLGMSPRTGDGASRPGDPHHLRLSRCFGTTSGFRMNMQTSWELEVAEDRLALGG